MASCRSRMLWFLWLSCRNLEHINRDKHPPTRTRRVREISAASEGKQELSFSLPSRAHLQQVKEYGLFSSDEQTHGIS